MKATVLLYLYLLRHSHVIAKLIGISSLKPDGASYLTVPLGVMCIAKAFNSSLHLGDDSTSLALLIHKGLKES